MPHTRRNCNMVSKMTIYSFFRQTE